jgi:hypothetical protein
MDTIESTVTSQNTEMFWDHWFQFSSLLSEIEELSGRVRASILAAKDTPRGGSEFHRVMYELRSQLSNTKTNAERFETMADEYERGIHRR